ncbi:superinfection immunity protein [Sulfurimonas aquatica]|uniref:Superinfection immunity protein n=1 Tax=Sulfurimonas aquatica TaxID=2672570 RepID=A0A975B2N2_9BACT|nr:superinfection immunity protein [Sulfurimonas aquatica]
MKREHPSLFLIGVLNFLLGFTLLVWVACFIWASTNRNEESNNSIRINIAEEIEKLDVLRKKGLLTDEEFKQQKLKILNS